MNLQLDPHVRAAFDAIVASAPELGDLPEPSELRRPDQAPRRTWLAAAAIAVIVAGVLGVAVLGPQRAAAPAPASAPSTVAPPPTEPPSNPLDLGRRVDDPAVLPERLPADWATTHETLPRWPDVRISDVTGTVSGFGLFVCDSGGATFHTALVADDVPEYSYYGTLCPFIHLIEPRLDVVAVCGTVSVGVHYARCQRKPAAAGEAEGMTIGTAVADVSAPPIDDLPTPTDASAPAPFGSTVSGPKYEAVSDDRVSIVLRDPEGVNALVWGSEAVCYQIILTGTMADGCHWAGAVASGLAYGVFRNRTEGVVDVVGVVPDEITSVMITGPSDSWSVAPVRNVWHVAVPAGQAFEITVTGTDGRQASTAIS